MPLVRRWQVQFTALSSVEDSKNPVRTLELLLEFVYTSRVTTPPVSGVEKDLRPFRDLNVCVSTVVVYGLMHPAVPEGVACLYPDLLTLLEPS